MLGNAAMQRALGIVAVLAMSGPALADPSPDHDPDPTEVIEVSGTAPAPPPEPVHDTIQATELHDLPGAGNDALRSLQSLPGVARIPYGLGGLALRGASPHDTHVFLDGVPVPILYHFGGLASFLPIDAIDRVEMTPSGAGAEWGGGIGGVVTVDSRSPHPTHWGAQGEISLLHAGVLATGPADNGGSWLIGMRRSYVDAVLAAAQVDLALAPSYLDTQVRWESGDRKWMFIAFASDDELTLVHDPSSAIAGINGADLQNLDYVSRFGRAGLRYQHDGVTVTPWVGLDHIDAVIERGNELKEITRFDISYGARAEVVRAALGGVLAFGGEAKITNYDYGLKNVPPPYPGDPNPTTLIDRENTTIGLNAGLFAEETWQTGPVTIRPGVRLDYYGLADTPVIDPRLTVSERVGGGILTQSIGMYHQSPLVTDLDPIFGDRKLEAPESIQASAAVEAPFDDIFVGKATVYGMVQSQLPVDVANPLSPVPTDDGQHAGGLLSISRELVDDQFGSYSYREYKGSGYSYGIELQARREIGRFTGWIAYAYARSYRTFDPAMNPNYYPYVLDQPHILTAVGTLPIGTHWRIGGRARVASGNPFTPVAGAMPTDKGWSAVDGPILSQRLPTFAQLDLRVDRIWRTTRGIWDLYLDVQNVTNRTNAEGITYNMDFSQKYYTTGLPVFPSIGVEYRPR
jgi:hypothetical protein